MLSPLRPLRVALVLLFGSSAAFAAPTSAEAPSDAHTALLSAAFNGFLGQIGRRAYTESRYGIGSEGKRSPETRIRVDPSKPYAERFTPLLVDGRAPTEKDRQWYARHGEAEA